VEKGERGVKGRARVCKENRERDRDKDKDKEPRTHPKKEVQNTEAVSCKSILCMLCTSFCWSRSNCRLLNFGKLGAVLLV